VVTAAGMIARSKGGYVATLQDPGPGVGLDGTIGTATRSGNPVGVFVLIHSSGTDAVTNASFVVNVVW
jgi:hypothetical protein